MFANPAALKAAVRDLVFVLVQPPHLGAVDAWNRFLGPHLAEIVCEYVAEPPSASGATVRSLAVDRLWLVPPSAAGAPTTSRSLAPGANLLLDVRADLAQTTTDVASGEARVEVFGNVPLMTLLNMCGSAACNDRLWLAPHLREPGLRGMFLCNGRDATGASARVPSMLEQPQPHAWIVHPPQDHVLTAARRCVVLGKKRSTSEVLVSLHFAPVSAIAVTLAFTRPVPLATVVAALGFPNQFCRAFGEVCPEGRLASLLPHVAFVDGDDGEGVGGDGAAAAAEAIEAARALLLQKMERGEEAPQGGAARDNVAHILLHELLPPLQEPWLKVRELARAVAMLLLAARELSEAGAEGAAVATDSRDCAEFTTYGDVGFTAAAFLRQLTRRAMRPQGHPKHVPFAQRPRDGKALFPTVPNAFGRAARTGSFTDRTAVQMPFVPRACGTAEGNAAFLGRVKKKIASSSGGMTSSGPRLLRPSSFGFKCPLDSSDNKNIGLVNSVATGATTSGEVADATMLPLVGALVASRPDLFDASARVPVYVNGHAVGACAEARADAAADWLCARLPRGVDCYVSGREPRALNVHSGSGAPKRTVLRVAALHLVPDVAALGLARLELLRVLEQLGAAVALSPRQVAWHVRRGHLIAPWLRDAYAEGEGFTFVEASTDLLYGACVQGIACPDTPLAVRAGFAAKMLRSCTALPTRPHSDAYPQGIDVAQTPLVAPSNQYHDASLDGRPPRHIHCVVCVAPNARNCEDAIVVSSRFADLVGSLQTNTTIGELQTDSVRIGPVPEGARSRMRQSRDALGADGMPVVGAVVHDHVVLAKTARRATKGARDRSDTVLTEASAVFESETQYGVVGDQTRREEALGYARVHVAQRLPIVTGGNKLSFETLAQKHVCAGVVRDEDMMFVEERLSYRPGERHRITGSPSVLFHMGGHKRKTPSFPMSEGLAALACALGRINTAHVCEEAVTMDAICAVLRAHNLHSVTDGLVFVSGVTGEVMPQRFACGILPMCVVGRKNALDVVATNKTSVMGEMEVSAAHVHGAIAWWRDKSKQQNTVLVHGACGMLVTDRAGAAPRCRKCKASTDIHAVEMKAATHAFMRTLNCRGIGLLLELGVDDTLALDDPALEAEAEAVRRECVRLGAFAETDCV